MVNVFRPTFRVVTSFAVKTFTGVSCLVWNKVRVQGFTVNGKFLLLLHYNLFRRLSSVNFFDEFTRGYLQLTISPVSLLLGDVYNIVVRFLPEQSYLLSVSCMIYIS